MLKWFHVVADAGVSTAALLVCGGVGKSVRMAFMTLSQDTND
jgi:hypothetical protein